MGRITIFTEDGCERSLALRSLLFDNSIQFHEISLSEHPERRSDMITLTNELSTPQVFFNSLHIGGLREIQDRFELYKQEALAKVHNGSNDSEHIDKNKDKNKDDNDNCNDNNDRGKEDHDLNNKFESKVTNPILERITSAVFSQQSPNHEAKLRLPPNIHGRSNILVHSFQDLRIEYESWNERLKENDFFFLRHGEGEERLSISNVTRSLMKGSSPLSDKPTSSSSSSLVSLPHYTIYDHYLKTGKVHKKCFKGKDAINVLKKEYKFLKTNNDVIAFGQTLLDLGIFHCIYSKPEEDDGASSENEVQEGEMIMNHFSENGIYRLQSLHSTEIKNKFRLWSKIDIVDKYDPHPLLTLSRLSKMLQSSIEQCSNINSSDKKDSNIVDYSRIQNSEIFISFEETLCLLQLTNLDDMFDKARLTFFINVYNLMVKHAIILQLNPCKPSFYSKDIKYMIGENVFSLDDIYHGILRCNSKHPKTGKEMFLSSPTSSTKKRIDPREKFKCQKLNPRIHFALITNYINVDDNGNTKSNNHHNNNASRNPHHHLLTTKYYHEFHQEAVNSELFMIARRSCKEDERIVVNERKNILNLPKFINLYLDDFISHNWNSGSGMDHPFCQLPKVMASYFIGEKRELIESMIKESPDSITVTFQDNQKSKSLVRRGFDCLPMKPWNHHVQRKRMDEFKGFGGFPQHPEEEDECSLLDKDKYDNYYRYLHHDGQEFDDNLSQSTGRSLREYNRSNSWDVMSLDDCSSWSLSLTSWGELPGKVDINAHNDKNAQVWEPFQSVSFHEQGFTPTAMSPSSPSGKESEGQESESSGKLQTPDGKNTNYLQSPSHDTVRTASTTRGSPSSFFESSPSSQLTAATPGRNQTKSSILIMPNFLDNDFVENSDDDEGLSFDTNGMDTQNDTDTSHDNCNDPPKARRVGREGLFKDRNNGDDKVVSTNNIINLFFQEDIFDDMNDKHQNKRSPGSSSSSSSTTDNDLDSLSYRSKNLRQESIGSLLSRDTDTRFEKLFNSSMASI